MVQLLSDTVGENTHTSTNTRAHTYKPSDNHSAHCGFVTISAGSKLDGGAYIIFICLYHVSDQASRRGHLWSSFESDWMQTATELPLTAVFWCCAASMFS